MPDNGTSILSDFLVEVNEVDISGLSLRSKYIRLKRILERSCKEITQNESLQFPSLFSRLVFIAQQRNFPKTLEQQLQRLRVTSNFLLRDQNNLVSPLQYRQAKESLLCFLHFVYEGKTDLLSSIVKDTNDTKDTLFLEKIRVQIVSIDSEQELLYCQSEQIIDHPLPVRYNVEHINDVFNSTIDKLWIGAQLNLIDVRIDKQGIYIPKMFVLEPDYLIDASAIAECFQNYGCSHLHYFRRKFEPSVNTHYILLGNLANFFLDELISADNIDSLTFDQVFFKSFQLMPFEYASCCDIRANNDFKEFMIRAQIQFDNIKRVVSNDMPANGFDRHKCILEPSFFSEKYGFQGRLDLLQLATDEHDLYRIIELKSGKPPYPAHDVTKVALNHEAQTVVYRLMIQSVFGKQARQIYPAILYSTAGNAGENLRLAAPYQQLEKEIINTRNLIVATEHDLYTGDSQTVRHYFNELFCIDNYGRIPQFFIERLGSLETILKKASSLEKVYFYRYVNFISRELYLQKMGDEAYDSSTSTSALWNTTFTERQEALDLIAGLEIDEIDYNGRGMTIRFMRSEATDFVNFREGEICILYPRQSDSDTVLSNQIMKGTIVDISAKHLVIRFRYKQRNQSFFSQYRYWAVEHDKLDHSYNAMFRGLFAFLSASPEKRELLLGLRQPQSTFVINADKYHLPKEGKQQFVIDKALAAEDYFLIVGPPGTGKTSIFARQLIERLHACEATNILVIAYTNRAVDELCAAICSAFDDNKAVCDKYIRIGTEFSCHEDYRPRLLQNLASRTGSRRELLQILQSTRIFVGTLASIIGKPELFDLKKFDIAIIDEASQILEPQIIGLLPQFDKFILIGDHKQLSTITLQSAEKSKVEDATLNDIGLYDCRESLFERLYYICQKRGWNEAYDTLTYHGRMHADIASLVNSDFYDGVLEVATQRQNAPLGYSIFDKEDLYQSLIASYRTAFIPVREVDKRNQSDKINEYEANEVVALAKALYLLYEVNGMNFDASKTLGVIAPYRNQIALIKHKLRQCGIPLFDDIMVDTVERYQGSQRDVIIVSFCFNRPYQMRFFANMNREGSVDRKLNVALTRAREQLFLVGNDYIMQQNAIYRQLIESINKNTGL